MYATYEQSNEAMARVPGESLDSWLRKRANKQQQVWCLEIAVSYSPKKPLEVNKIE